MAEEPVAERGVLTAPAQIWETAVRQAEVIGPLAAKDIVGLAEADEAAGRLRFSRRQVYVLIGRWRAGEGVVSDLLPGRSRGIVLVGVVVRLVCIRAPCSWIRHGP